MEINLTSRLPVGSRNVKARLSEKTPERVRISRQFGREYFDGLRLYGYGGYIYDGRWIPVAQDMIRHFDLKSGCRVLDVGCAKGFLVHDLMKMLPGLEVFGVDISDYALKNCHPEVVGRLQKGSAIDLPFPDHSFDAVISINTLHNLDLKNCIKALQEIERVTKSSNAYVQVDSYKSDAEKKLFEDWALTCETHGYPSEWKQIFIEAGYLGDYFWTYVE